MNHLNKNSKIIFLLIILVGISLTREIPIFDENKAFSNIVKQCNYGPRFPNSPGHELFKNYLIDFVTENADEIKVYTHNIKHPYKDKKIHLYNILARYNPTAENRFMIMAHWDTREVADRDPQFDKRTQPILGANDGGSGTAILMVLAEMLNQYKLELLNEKL